jgi:UDPglucose--hexose-1-phosphate uridylyltransferase
VPEIRKDPVFGQWVIIASERGRRPNEFTLPPEAASTVVCPFCPGREDQTPPTVCQCSGSDGKWKIRVVSNKFPALTPEPPPRCSETGPYQSEEGLGIHEVIIETPVHDLHMDRMDEADLAAVLSTYVERIRELKKDPRIKYVMIFKNHGRNAGASLSHPHSQLVGMPMVPTRLSQEIEGAAKYMSEKGSCVYCDMAAAELEGGRRLILREGPFVAIAPYASRFSFETWIMPVAHASHFEDIPPADIPALAATLKEVLSRLNSSVEGLAYNLIIHTTPVHAPQAGHYHWHIEIMPKLAHVAGFEWGTGFYINTVSPEEAAETLRSGKKHKG